MTNEESNKPDEQAKFTFCPQCGRKGMYHIKQKYYRCRYCGTYLISPSDKKDIKE